MTKMTIALKDLISEILNKMFFMMESNPPKEFSETYDYYVDLVDDFFDIKVYVSKVTASEITMNFLGLDEQPTDEDILDSLSEILNMIIGNFVGAHFPAHKSTLFFPVSKKGGFAGEEKVGFEKELLFYDKIPFAIFLKIKK